LQQNRALKRGPATVCRNVACFLLLMFFLAWEGSSP
jgi:hypothetical protein